VPDNTVVEVFDGSLDGVNTQLVIYAHTARHADTASLTKPELSKEFTYLFNKINSRMTQGPLTLSLHRKSTNIRKYTQSKAKQKRF